MGSPNIILPDETVLSGAEYCNLKRKIISCLAEEKLTVCSAKVILSEVLDEIDRYATLKIGLVEPNILSWKRIGRKNWG